MSYHNSSRRSRSRSPRGTYQPRNVYEYPPESAFREWDSSDKDRAWAAYERDRGPYELGRRGRSRSPDDYNRKRRRSPSPYERDRYDPRPRYNDDFDAHSRGYGYSPPRRHGQQFSSRRPPPDPHTFEYPANLRQYAEWFRYFFPTQANDEDNADKAAEQEAGDGSKPRNGIRSRWEKYKKDFAANQLQTMFEHHKKSPWFWEKYDPSPEYHRLRQRVRKEGWKGRLNTFLLDLESGKYDPDLNEPESESAVNKDHANGDVLPTDGEEPKPAADDDQFDAEDDAGADVNGKPGIDNKRSNKGEELAVPPEGNQVMIRTIPPDIGRVKLEESCKQIPNYVYLALGDPLQKRNYYRAGWLRFNDEADMTMVMSELQDRKIEGFKLHVSHTTKPFINKIRVAPDVASRPERMEKDLTNIKVLAGLLEDEAAVLRKSKPGRDDAQPKPEGGDDVPMEGNNVENGDGDVDGEDDEEEPPERGSDAVDRRIEKIMADMRDQGLVDAGDETAYEAKKTEVSLDLYLAYLRAAYHACYYCSVVTDHLEELQRKCIKHVRKPLPKALPVPDETKAANGGEGGEDEDKPAADKDKESPKKDSRNKNDRGDDRWLDWLDLKIALLINRNGVDPRDYGGKSYDEELAKLVEPHIKQEDEGKFRCRVCSKLFKATSFVEKHIANKHPELVKALEDVPYFNNFALDPHRIQPFAHPPALAGNSTQAPPQAFGIQAPANSNYGDYGRIPPPYPYPYPPGWGDYGPGKGYYDYPPGGQRREDVNGRRLSERISVDVPTSAGLPPKPTMDGPLSAGNTNNNGNRRRNTVGQASGPPPPPPPDAKEDPRAAAGRRVSYHDMDLVAEGDVELTY